MGTTGRRGVRSRLAEEIYTCCAFWIAVSTLPALAISYAVVRVSKHLWLKLLSSRYPGFEFITTDTVRSLLDTHRNQGIINVLLSIQGTLDVDLIKQYVAQHVTDKTGPDGQLAFPRLRQQLVSCWGNYAWNANVTFNFDNHVVVSNGVYRGRPVSDYNIQDYVSDIVSKYFPSDQPPWQYIIIPCVSAEPKYYILVRVHHLLLSGKQSINIGDLLMLEPLESVDEGVRQNEYTQQSPLTKLLPTSYAIPELWEKLNESLSNAWNEFISEYDPVECPGSLKTLPGAFHVASIVLISATSAIRELTKRRSNERDSQVKSTMTATVLLAAIQRECKRRNLTIPKVIFSPLVTADPRKWPRRVVTTTLATLKTVIKLPLHIRDELLALRELKSTGLVTRPDTFTWKYAGLAQLSARAALEAWRGLVETYRAPYKLWTDTVATDDGQRHLLQSVSLCGRKVAAWSRPVPRAGVERAARALGVSSTDIALYAATEALRTYFEQAQGKTPEMVLTTARAASEEFLFSYSEDDGKKYRKLQSGGMVCLSLPVGGTPRRVAAVVEQACARQAALAGAWAAQARCGALTRAVPSPFARLTLNMLSRRYAVSYAEVRGAGRARRARWGGRVDHLLYWRPPQANVSMSLTVIEYASTVRLAVMADARLSPAHAVPASRWPAAIDQLIAKVDQEIARIAAQAQPDPAPAVPHIVTDTYDDPPAAAEPSTSDTQTDNTLRPPAAPVMSPPPIRRQKSRN